MMKLVLTAAATLVLATPALAEDWDFVLVNNAGKTIKAIEVSPAGAGTWVADQVEPERRRMDTKPGGKMTVHFDKGSGCKYDLKASFSDDSSGVWTGIDVCKFSFVTISYRNGTPIVSGS